VYIAVLLIALHFIWSVKSDINEPLLYWAMTLVLLTMRKSTLQQWWLSRQKQNSEVKRQVQK
ncbi:MAG: sulfoxide reductase heme-binding subunit YedZ, partial [Paraglaciecola sp.]|nr:sulfoxide reductase heme-binding subunit YedZ [Paraglaciecola sp.]